MPSAIEADRIGKMYATKDEEVGLRELSLDVPPGQVLALLGPNGAGKTTAVRGLATLLPFDRGRARICGHDVRHEAATVREKIGLVGQDAAVDEQLTAEKNLFFFGRLRGLARAAAARRTDELLTRFGLEDARGRPVGSYSGGMRRRLDLAAGLVVPPEVLFVDEPTTGLDPAARRGLWKALRALVADGTTILLTTQYLEEADELADQIVLLARGVAVAHGSPDELKAMVGPPLIHLRFDTPEDARTALPALGRIDDAVHLGESGTATTLPATSPHTLGEAVEVLATVGVTAAEVMLRRPSLDDVFLTLTGASADTEEAA